MFTGVMNTSRLVKKVQMVLFDLTGFIPKVIIVKEDQNNSAEEIALLQFSLFSIITHYIFFVFISNFIFGSSTELRLKKTTKISHTILTIKKEKAISSDFSKYLRPLTSMSKAK